jgi:hypothetical protein
VGVARLIAAVVFSGCVALLAAAAWTQPDRRGLGTHQQFGLPPCTMVMMVGYPCPTCGMSTAFAHAVRGELVSAFRAQPAGLVLAIAVAVAAALSLGVIVTGEVWAVNWYRVSPSHVVLGVVLLILGGWGYKLAVGVMTGLLPVGR